MKISRKFVRNTLLVLSIIAAVVLIKSFTSSSKLVGTWVLSKNQIGGGIMLEIDKDTITAKGSSQKYLGDMKFKYKVISNSELVLTYRWSFNGWPWNFSRAEEIPLRYSVDKANGTLSLSWDGTDFVLLENNMDKMDMQVMGWKDTPGFAWTSGVGTITFQKSK